MHFSLRTGPPHVLQLAQPPALFSMGDTQSEGLQLDADGQKSTGGCVYGDPLHDKVSPAVTKGTLAFPT